MTQEVINQLANKITILEMKIVYITQEVKTLKDVVQTYVEDQDRLHERIATQLKDILREKD